MAFAMLTGLPGVRAGKSLRAAFFSSPEEGLKLLRKHGAITAASDTGAINAWRDDEGNYRCERQRRMVTHSSTKSPSLQLVKVWLAENLPLIKAESVDPLRTIEMTFAYERASSLIDMHCRTVDAGDGSGEYLDLETASADVDDEVAYLDSRRLLLHHERNPRWVSICDEGEPVAEVDRATH